jgi:hypothetical protein
MCGIHGVINKSFQAKREFTSFMDNAFVVNTLRGMDSAGIFQVDKDFRPYSHKMNVPGFAFAESKQAKRFFSDADNSIITVGHVRAATHGKVTIDNAHPFVVGKPSGKRLIGVHNGTIHNWKQHKTSNLYDVDSEWALSRIAADGIDAFEDFAGAYAFVWWDEDTPDKLYMGRNSERPLHILQTKTKDSILFASEAGMLSWLAERNKIDTADELFLLEEQKIYTFDLSKVGKIEWTKAFMPKFKSTYTPAANGASCNLGNRYQPQRGDPGRWNPQLGRWEDSTPNATGRARESGEGLGDDDWDDDSMLGWGPNQGGGGYLAHRQAMEENAEKGASVGGSRPISFPLGAERLVEETKKALSANRADRIKRQSGTKQDTGTSGKLEEGVANAIAKVIRDSKRSDALAVHTAHKQTIRLSKKEKKKQRIAETKAAKPEPQAKLAAVPRTPESDDSGRGDFICPVHWFDTGSATGAEQQAAKSSGVMGELQWFKGALFEPETGELYGDIEEYIPGVNGGKIIHTGVMRHMTAAAADRNWINNKETGGWVAVVGLTDINQFDSSKAIIVTPLTEAGLSQMKKQAA